MGERGYLSSISGILALVLCGQGRYDEASHYVQQAQELGADDDFTTQLYWRCAQAEIRASEGDYEAAFGLLDDADRWIVGTDYVSDNATALITRSVVERASGDAEGARAALERGIELLELKGDVSAAAYMRRRLAEI